MQSYVSKAVQSLQNVQSSNSENTTDFRKLFGRSAIRTDLIILPINTV